MIAQLVIGLVIFASLAGGFLSWKHDIRAEGEARAVKEYEKQQLEAAKENERIAAEGKAAVLRLLSEAETRNRAQAQQMLAAQRQRRSESESQAAKDVGYKLWADQPVPAFELARLRNATKSIAPDASSRVLSDRIAIPARESVPANTGDNDESRLRRIRVAFGFAPASGVGERGTVADSLRAMVAHTGPD